ncbi:FAD-dependent oxidoreductase [Streptomyces liangshanensis]|uniref:FAD-dependent oxidoreductase n=1 Tax=Streptomyces liangshanensis TaxID=2717324 RepID=UPI0036DDF53D
MAESPISVFDRLVNAGPPSPGVTRTTVDTACVLGGSIAGLLAARVLADHARQVIVVERDETGTDGRSRAGVPQDQQVHSLLPGGRLWIERWLPGFTREAQDLGAVLATPEQSLTCLDGRPQAPGAAHALLGASRPFLESRLRARVLALPNVSAVRSRATGLTYRDGAVSGVRHATDHGEEVLAADFVVDAMGRSSRLSEWVHADGYDKPRLERLASGIHYASALFERSTPAEDLSAACSLAVYSPPYPRGGTAVAAVNAIEDDKWLALLVGFGEDRPGRSVEDFRAVCEELPPVYQEAARGAAVREVVTYRQADSRRRGFSGLERFPARLVSVGDAVASFNPVYGQGMSSAALHASCLAEFLEGGPRLDRRAEEFFRLQDVVVDAAWAVSAGGDAARLDAENGVEVPEEVRQQRWALQQVIGATVVDGDVAQAFNQVSFMLRHPFTLADPHLLERAVAANGAPASGGR